MVWRRFPHYRPFVSGINWSPIDPPHKGPVMRKLDVSYVVSIHMQWNQLCYYISKLRIILINVGDKGTWGDFKDGPHITSKTLASFSRECLHVITQVLLFERHVHRTAAESPVYVIQLSVFRFFLVMVLCLICVVIFYATLISTQHPLVDYRKCLWQR